MVELSEMMRIAFACNCAARAMISSTALRLDVAPDDVWVPASGNIGVGVSILSYAGGVQFGLVTDEALCADPQAIIDRFEPEFEKLLLLTMMLPWGGD